MSACEARATDYGGKNWCVSYKGAGLRGNGAGGGRAIRGETILRKGNEITKTALRIRNEKRAGRQMVRKT